MVSGSFNAALIPTYIQVREQEGQQAAQQLFSSVVVFSLALLIGIAVLMGLTFFDTLKIMWGLVFDPDKLALTRSMFLILLICLPFSGLFTIWGAVLNAHERFALAAMTPMLTSLAVMIAVYLFSGTLGIYSFVLAIIAGSCAGGRIIGNRIMAKRGSAPAALVWLHPGNEASNEAVCPDDCGRFDNERHGTG